MYIHIYIYIYVCLYIYIYIYIYANFNNIRSMRWHGSTWILYVTMLTRHCYLLTYSIMTRITKYIQGNLLYYRIYIYIYIYISSFLTRPVVFIAVNKIDIQRVRYLLSRVRVTIVWSLWHHRQWILTSSAERKASEWDTGIVYEDPRFSVIYGFVMSCKKKK